MENHYNIEFKVIASADNAYTDYISKQTLKARQENKARKLAHPDTAYYPVRTSENGL